MKKVPKRRFKGFLNAGDWEQRKLGEIFEYLQNNTLSRDSLNYKNPNVKNIHYGDILVKFDEILDGSNKDIPYINSEVDLSKFSKSLLRDGDIIFSDTAEDDTVGKAIELQNVNAPFILSGLHTIPCRPLIPFGKGYLGNFLNSDSYRLQLRPLVQGIKVSSISKSALKDTMIEYPKNLDEQEKIGSLFYYIAKMITLHQRKLEKLQATKKALLYELFPIENSRRPKLRFKGFTGDWEQRKLGELLEQPITDGPHETPELYDSGIPFISVDAIVDNKIDFTKMRGYISKEYDDICAKKYKPQINDVYLVKSGATIGKVAIVDTYDDFNIWSPLAAMRCGSITNPYFLYVLLQTKDLQTQVFNKASHGTQPNLSMRQLETFTCKVPKIEEQILISQFFKRLNDSITLHQRKLEKLKNLKAAYLNEMFV